MLMSILAATGPIRGINMKAISKKSMKKPSTNTNRLTNRTKPSSPPGIKLNRCSIQRSPLTARNDRAKIDEPTRINITKVDNLAVESNAPLITSSVKRRRMMDSNRVVTGIVFQKRTQGVCLTTPCS